MASNLLILLDDIAATLDDVAVMTKVSLKKTSALMSDDLAVNAGVIHGVKPTRELPLVGKIFAGSLVNKVLGIAIIIGLNILYPPILKWLLFLGGLYLAYEGFHKVHEKIFKHKKVIKKKTLTEREKMIGAIKTDFILSIEIIMIANGSIITDSLFQRLLALSSVGIIASIIIYGLVAFIIKIDDFGMYLVEKGYKSSGVMLINSMPKIMKLLGIVGTVAMFLVAGGIFTHTFHLDIISITLIQDLLLGIMGGFVTFLSLGLFIRLSRSTSN